MLIYNLISIAVRIVFCNVEYEDIPWFLVFLFLEKRVLTYLKS